MQRIAFVLLAALLMVPSTASLGHADTAYTYTLNYTGSGSLDGTVFTDAAVTISLGMINVVVGGVGGTLISSPALYAIVVVVGTGEDTFTDSMAVEVDGNGNLYFIDLTMGKVLVGVENYSAFASYGLTTSIGPVTGNVAGWSYGPFDTTGGDFTVATSNGISSPEFFATVEPVATPEPSSLALLMVGFSVIGVGVVITKRKEFDVPLVG
jgi:PEP-CTERM motif-containing protein